MKAKHARASSTTIPVPSAGTSEEKIEIPHALLPVLDVMRHHISELARDNQAMRYTFGLDSVATTSKITVDSSQPAPLSTSPAGGGREGLDLKAVVDRVRALVKENEELGDLLLEAGRVDTEEWERTLAGKPFCEAYSLLLLIGRLPESNHLTRVRFDMPV